MTEKGSARGPSPIQEIDSGLAYFRGKVVPLKEANINIATHALNYGTGCFEGIRAYWNEKEGQLFGLFMREHFERFLDSCSLLRIDPGLTVPELVDVTKDLLRQNAFRQDAYVRPLAFKASRVVKVGLSGLRDEVAIFVAPLGDYVSVGGLSLQVSTWHRIPDNAVPSRSKTTGSYVNGYLAADQAHRDGYDEALLLNQAGHVAEASGANLFIVRKGTLVTPPVTEDILEGLTRTSVFELAKAEGIPVLERPIDRSELFIADEAFLTGTAAQIAPVTMIDKRKVGSGSPGPISIRLQEIYFRAARGDDPKYRHWLTPVY